MKKSLLDRIEKLAGATGFDPIDIYFSTVDRDGVVKGKPEYFISVMPGGKPCRQLKESEHKIILPL
jgi:hypothetical protein